MQLAHLAGMEVPVSQADLEQAAIETAKVNDLHERYIRPLVYLVGLR